MSEFVEVKISDLTGVQLDWAVAQVEKPEGFVMRDAIFDMGWIIGISRDSSDPTAWLKSSYAPSIDWRQGGPLIDKYRVELTHDGEVQYLESGCWAKVEDCIWALEGNTALIASCRAIVASVFGLSIKIPKELFL